MTRTNDVADNKTSRWAHIAIPLLASLVVLVTHVPFASEPFANDHEGSVGSIYEGPIQRHYEHFGFWSVGGRPVLHAIPTEPPRLKLYAHHPPLLYWMIRPIVATFGLKEWTIRALPILCSAILAALVTSLAARAFGAPGAIATGVLACTLPIMLTYGRMANYELPIMVIGLIGQNLLPSRSHALGFTPHATRRRLQIACVLVFLATLVDWAGAFLVVGFCIQEWVALRRMPRATLALAFGVSSVVAVAGYFGLLCTWTGGWLDAWHEIRSAIQLTRDLPHGELGGVAWLAESCRLLATMLGWPGVVVLAIGLLWATTRRASESPARATLAGSIWCWVSVALLNQLMFPAHAIVHDYWWWYVAPAAMLAAAPIVGIAKSCGAIRTVLIWVSVLIVAGTGIYHHVRRENEIREFRNPTLNLAIRLFAPLYDENTLLIWSDADISWFRSIYLRPWIIAGHKTDEEIVAHVAAFKRGDYHVRRLVIAGVRRVNGRPGSIGPELVKRLATLGLSEGSLPTAPAIACFETTR